MGGKKYKRGSVKGRRNKEQNNKNNGGYDNNTYYNELSENQIKSLELLKIQLMNNFVNIYAYFLVLMATLEGIQIVYDNSAGKKTDVSVPDALVLQALYIFLCTQLVSIYIATERYNMLSEQKEAGEFNYSLEPNQNIIIGNIFGAISDIYFIAGSEEIYKRDRDQAVFGV